MLVSRSVSLVTQKKHKGVANQIIKEHRQIIKKHMKKTNQSNKQKHQAKHQEFLIEKHNSKCMHILQTTSN